MTASEQSAHAVRPLRVAFLGGTGRSGSTLVSRVLGSLPGACSVGELSWLWTFGLKLNRPCGCGEPFDACPFWVAVGERLGGWSTVDAEHAIALRRRLTANRRLPELLARPTATTQRDVTEYTRLLAALYAAIRDVSGADVIIDNSKQPAMAMVTRRTPGVDVSVVHLVRRSHGVAYSWTKHVARADKDGREMRRRGPARTALRWSVDNALLELLGRTGTPTLTLRYEDFVTSPREQTDRVATFLGLPTAALDELFPTPHTVQMGTDHSVWGNPMRSRSGPEELRADDAWRRELPSSSRRVVTALSWPALVRYRYTGRG